MSRKVYWDERDVVNRLKRIEGQVRGIQQLVGQRESCRAILTQISAAQGALDKVGKIVETCSVAEALLEVQGMESVDTETVRGTLKEVIRGR